MKLKYFRQLRGVSQSECAEAIGVSFRSYQRIESCELIPSYDQQIRIAACLGVDFDDIFSPRKAEKPKGLKILSQDEFLTKHAGCADLLELSRKSKFKEFVSFEQKDAITEWQDFKKSEHLLCFADYRSAICNRKTDLSCSGNTYRSLHQHGWDLKELLQLWDYLWTHEAEYFSYNSNCANPKGDKGVTVFNMRLQDKMSHVYTFGVLGA